MEKSYIRHITCKDFQVAISCEANRSFITDIYQPSTSLVYTEEGILHFRINESEYRVERGHFGLLRKFTKTATYKTFIDDKNYAKVYVLTLPNEFIRKVINKFKISKNCDIVTDRFINISATGELDALMQSIKSYVDSAIDMNLTEMEIKTAEALSALAKADDKLLNVFKEFAISERADIEALMNHNYLYDIPLSDLAEMSGRSLSTFNREFRLLFTDTPHRWIKRKRLEYARSQMMIRKISASDVYLDAGFNDLSHFCKSFITQYNQSPSDFYKSLF